MTTRRARASVQRAAPYVVASLFAASSVVHLLRPAVFLPLVPGWLPARRQVVTVSGLAEIACAAGLFARRPWAGPASAALLAVVWVGNVEMALRAGPGVVRALAWARVPLQVPLIWGALQADRSPRARTGASGPRC